MDPVSQAFLGAAAAQSMTYKKEVQSLWPSLLVGALGGMAPDLDVLFTSSHDSLFQIEFHRHFTHSIFFAPVAGFFVACVVFPLYKKLKLSFKRAYLYATFGAMTHGFLDASTSYGTHLFWPFTQERESWSIISIIDPLFTLPLAALCFYAAKKGSAKWARLALAWIFVYLSFGAFQHSRAFSFYQTQLKQRGQEHLAGQILVKPTIANLWVWRGVAVFDNHYRVDGIRLGLFQKNDLYRGQEVEKFKAQGPWGKYVKKGQVWRDLNRFSFFSEGLIYQLPEQPELVGDLRYSLLPHSIQPLWVVELTPGQAASTGLEFYYTRNVTKEKRALFMKMLMGETIRQEVLDKY